MCKILDGLPGVLCMIDDVVVHGKSQDEHEQRLRAVLDQLQRANVSLNKAKCESSRNSVKFLSQIINQSGIKPDPNKVNAFQTMTEPTNITELRRLLGMTNQISKFTPHLSNMTKPLRDLSSTKNLWIWGLSFHYWVQRILTSCRSEFNNSKCFSSDHACGQFQYGTVCQVGSH